MVFKLFLSGWSMKKQNTTKYASKKVKFSKIKVLKNLTRIWENNGPEKVDWKLKFSKRENRRLQIIIVSMKDKLEAAWINITVSKKNGALCLINYRMNSKIISLASIDWETICQMEKILLNCKGLREEKKIHCNHLMRNVEKLSRDWMIFHIYNLIYSFIKTKRCLNRVSYLKMEEIMTRLK